MTTKLFGTDGIRGQAGRYPLDPATVRAIGQAVGEQLGGPIIVGRDPRESSPWIFGKIRNGLEAAGVAIEDAGVIPTPAVALLVKTTPAHGGVMISASHNPYEDNGIKVFGPDGQKLEDASEAAVEYRLAELRTAASGSGDESAAEAGPPAPPAVAPVWGDRYMALVRRGFPAGGWLEGLHITLDCANGATTTVAPALFGALGARVSVIHGDPDGRNINAGCGAVHPASLIRAVRANGSDLGVAYDGDGDRSMFASSSGRLIDGDAVLLVMARRMQAAGMLSPAVVVGTSMTNYSLERMLGQAGIRLVRVDVGDRYIFREMLSSGAVLGGEPSGHIIFSDYRLSGDGLLTTLKLCQAVVEDQVSLDELARDWEAAPQLLRNVPVAERVPLEALPRVRGKVDEIARALGGRGRIVVRYSGTEPLLRVMIESDSSQANERHADALVAVIRAELPEPA